MTLPQLTLDDRDFQSLVSEARTLIAKTCPEWTEHNVSDPGITLIELFAWMTDILIYRVNQIPENVEIKLLNLLAVTLVAPSAAETDLRFMLAEPPRRDVTIPAHATEVATIADDRHDAIVFRVAQDAMIPVLELQAIILGRRGRNELVLAHKGSAVPSGVSRAVFATPPAAGDALYLGTPRALDGLVVRVSVDSSVARGTGILPDRPPWIWEVSPRPGAEWAPAEVLRDTSGGLNLPGPRVVELQLPALSGRTTIEGQNLYWLRCRLPDPPGYLESPELNSVSIAAIGVMTKGEHATLVEYESLGTSDGTPNQSFHLLHAPTLQLGEGEGLEVQDPDTGHWEMWEQVDSFADSIKSSRHYVYDAATGEVRFGPSIRIPRTAAALATTTLDPDERPTLEAWRQCGRIPRAGSLLRINRYHHGGGYEGNVPAEALVVLRTPIPGVAGAVTNPRPATGGVGLEDIDAARQRAARELRTRKRAITKDDYELLARQADNTLARVLCEIPEPGGKIPIRVLPRISGDPVRFLTREELTPSEAQKERTRRHLMEVCPIGASVHVTGVGLRAVTVVVEVEAEPVADLAAVRETVLAALYGYLNPLVGGDAVEDERDQNGWEWGRRLTVGELHPIVRAVPQVRSVVGLRAYETKLLAGTPPTDPDPKPLNRWLDLHPSELIVSGRHLVRAVKTRRG
jgi:predicted phage baseplate assembly protein